MQVTLVYNAWIQVRHICSQMEDWAKHRVFLPPDTQGLTDDQIEELKLRDEKCVTCGSVVLKKKKLLDEEMGMLQIKKKWSKF